MRISVIIPVWNEASTLGPLFEELREVAASQYYDMEVIFVDDGSTDGSWREIQRIAAMDPRVVGLRFRTNVGKSEAWQTGFRQAQGDVLITMDADLQDDPLEIPRLLMSLEEGADLVSGWKQQRHDSWLRRASSLVFNGLVNRLTPVRLHDHNCGLKAMRREVTEQLNMYGELHRFMAIMAGAQGFRVTEIPVRHRPRKFGKSKYGWRRIPQGLLDVMTVAALIRYRGRPQHAVGWIGLLTFLTGLAITFILAVWWLISRLSDNIPDLHLHERAVFYFGLAGLLLGAQLLSLGILAELMTWSLWRDRSSALIAERTPIAERVSDAKVRHD